MLIASDRVCFFQNHFYSKGGRLFTLLCAGGRLYGACDHLVSKVCREPSAKVLASSPRGSRLVRVLCLSRLPLSSPIVSQSPLSSSPTFSLCRIDLSSGSISIAQNPRRDRLIGFPPTVYHHSSSSSPPTPSTKSSVVFPAPDPGFVVSPKQFSYPLFVSVSSPLPSSTLSPTCLAYLITRGSSSH